MQYKLGSYLQTDSRDTSKKFIPTDEDFKNISEGDLVEVMFENDDHQVEILTVKVTNSSSDNEPYSFSGNVFSNPQILTSPSLGEEVHFGSRNISNIYPKE